MPRTLIALGANLGDRAHALRRAVELLAAHPASAGVVASGRHETAPVGGPGGQGSFLNAAVALDTSLAPEQLHALLVHIETELGRTRGERWAARAIDLDLLLFGDEVINTQALEVPHPRLAFRRFVLAPAAEVAPHMVHPLAGWTIRRLLAHLDEAPPYVAILGMPDSGRARLAERVAEAVGGRYLALHSASGPAASGDDPSGPPAEGPIQFLDRARALLSERAAFAGPSTTVSDFYLDECLAQARLELDGAAYESFYRTWSATGQTVVQPKLLVVLDTWADAVAARAGIPRLSSAAPPQEPLRGELLRLATRAGIGPVLFAGREDSQKQFEEITAAIAAMT